ncbi:hypothetical protein A1O1_04068 [Capronia coronata CBS 617.96]|uniref:Protein kinase domain-containing protein n=1 Tax=Capronia coronata CBS 617.96 TaxID=1182541 RepID=W9YP10_9EURO|nr:uncharacterized protein A1O1_04068 [Capronia coronata CBS 617.96]EXJ90961.1 hypothetical protein A1O1_04068 [Capronia coronata CBS 617.96]
MARPESREEDDVVEDLFSKLEQAQNDPDELIFDCCLEDVRELAISACKHTMYTLAASGPKMNREQRSLEEFLYPTTFYLPLRIMIGKLQAVRIDDISSFASMYEPGPVRWEMDLAPRSASAPALTPSAEICFIEDLFMRRVLKVSKNGKSCVFKSPTPSNEDQLQREINVLQQISEIWPPDYPCRPHVPRFLGLEFDIAGASATQRRKWKDQIEQSISLLHQNGIVWGDVKPRNIIIDKSAHAWLVDFGGSWTNGWVDEDLAETLEGDLQGLRRVAEYLGVQD